MSEPRSPKPPRGPFHAFTDWLKRTPPPGSDDDAPTLVTRTPPPMSTGNAGVVRGGPPARIAQYTILDTLGQGGMGIVYSARDEKLGRTVAIKMMSALGDDDASRKRFWREARAAASVNHPNVCQLYEIGEDEGRLFIAMELLEGQSLGERLQGGPLNVAEALPIGLGMLAALGALHARGIVHRDLKPSNVFLTPHGVKLLDFGLAREVDPALAHAADTSANLTGAGFVIGTPRYMAPEQVTGEGLDGRSDLFATGAILFEMLAGRPAFTGRNVVEILHATLHEQPPALTGSPAVAAVDRVIRRALAKSPASRPETAEVMAAELRAVSGAFGEDAPAPARTLTRLIVLPFRVLRPDPETDFLAFSLPDAISTSLSRFGSLIVRSSAAAARFAGATPDLKALAADAAVDRVVMGTVLRSGDQLQATAQLVEAPSGTLLSSESILASLGDLFRLQDDICRRVVEALSLPLTGGPATPTPGKPQNAAAYALYLRANDLGRNYEHFPAARDLYEQVIQLDPEFAAAWAQLARTHLVIGKYVEGSDQTNARAEAALKRALEIDPRLTMAHKIYANIEADSGHAADALKRLLGEANRRGNDPELFSGLVHACRYCGLLEQSIAAHAEARRLDPNVPTGYEQTVLMTCDFEQLLTIEKRTRGPGTDEVIRVVGLGMLDRRAEARERLVGMRGPEHIPAFRPWINFLMAWLDRKPVEMREHRSQLGPLNIMNDPEAMFQEAWMFSDVGDLDRGLELIQRAVAKGYFVAPTLEKAPQFDAMRGNHAFLKLLDEARAGRDRALAVFHEGGGEKLLGN